MTRFLRSKWGNVLLVLATLVCLSLVIVEQENRRYELAEREHIAEHVQELVHRLESKYNAINAVAEQLATAVALTDRVPSAMLERSARELVKDHPEIETVAIAPDLTVTHVAPLEGNEAALGTNYKEIPPQLAAASRAYRSREPVLSPPVDLVQGGRGHILIFPIFAVGDGPASRRPWGVISIVLRDGSLLAFPDDGDELDVALRSVSGGGQTFSNADVFDRDAVIRPARFLDEDWEIAAVPADGWPAFSPAVPYTLFGLAAMSGLIILAIIRIQSLSEQREKVFRLLHNAVEALDAGFVLYDEKGKLVVCNTKFAAPFQMTVEEMHPGISYESLIRLVAKHRRPDDRELPDEEWIEQRLSGHVEGQEYLVKQVDGKWVKVSETRTPEGYSVSVITDITTQKNAQIAAEAANREKSDFLSNVTHELRTPLTVIIGYAQMMSGTTVLPQTARFKDMVSTRQCDLEQVLDAGRDYDDTMTDFGGRIEGSAEHMLAMVNDLLDWAEAERGRIELDRKSVSVCDFIGGIVEDLQPQAAHKGLELMAECEEASVSVDTKRLRQVFYNLIGNAIRFTEAGHVKVGARVIEGNVAFIVEDTGCGIPEEHLDRIFEKFHQVDNSSTRSHGGFGLGLAIAKRIVALHGGDIWASSEVGVGSRIIFRIPAAEETRAAA
ncbi:MAG: ATP-binding protein [Pseudooceanicola sp.]